jgi:hypothetical protein
MIALDVGNMNGIILLLILLWVLPPLLLWSIGGYMLYKKKKNTALIFGILGVVYLLILAGFCFSL